MRAADELARLQAKLADGSLPPDEPLFVLRAQDATAPNAIMEWIRGAAAAGASPEKVQEAGGILMAFINWPIHQVPGRPETRDNVGRY